MGHVLVTSDLLRVHPGATLDEAYDRMQQAGSLGLAVTDGDQLVGVLSRRDIGVRALAPEGKAGVAVREVMQTPVPLDYDDPIETALERLVDDTGLVLPVNRMGEFAGIVTWAQVAHFLNEVMQLDSKAPRLHLALINAPGQLARVLVVLGRAKVNVVSALLSDPKITGLTHVVLKVEPGSERGAAEALRVAGFTLID